MDNLTNIPVKCESCACNIGVDVASTDATVLRSIKEMIERTRLYCTDCTANPTTATNMKATNPAISRIQLESYQILMSEMVDSRLSAQLEWEHAQNLKSLLSLFNLKNDELDGFLSNPNRALMLRGRMWVTLSNTACHEIRDALADKVVI